MVKKVDLKRMWEGRKGNGEKMSRRKTGKEENKLAP